MSIPASELIINEDGSVFHLHIRPSQLADRIVLVGDPGRVALMKPFLDTIECEGASREFVWATGTYNGTRLTILSTGIGANNIDIVMTELDALKNVDFQTREIKAELQRLTIVRLGTCGVVQPDIPLGAYVLSHCCIGFDGLLDWYSKRDSIVDLKMESAFMKHMDWPAVLPYPYVVHAPERLIRLFEKETVKGLTISGQGFYGPQGRVVRQGLVIPDLLEKIESFHYEDWRVTNIEMEGASVAGMASQLGHDAITVCFAIAHRYLKGANTDYRKEMDDLIKLVLDKLSSL